MGTVNLEHRRLKREKTKAPEMELILKAEPTIKAAWQRLGDEIESLFHKSGAVDRKKVEDLMKSFMDEFRSVFPKSENKRPSLIEVFKKVRRLLRSDEVDDYGCDRAFEEAIKPFFDFLFFKYWRVDVQGVENIPSTGRALLVSNHSGVLAYDASMVKVAGFNEHPARREVRFMVDDFVFHFPFLGVFMNRTGGVRACPENAERLLRQEELVAVFPEGIKGISKPFSERYHLQRFGRGGVVKLALKTQAPIIPVSIIGAEEIHPLIYKSSLLARPLGLPFIPVTPTFPLLGPLGALPLPTKWSIRFGKPIPFDQYSAKDINDGILINRETEKLRAVIQDMISTGLKNRRSVFFG